MVDSFRRLGVGSVRGGGGEAFVRQFEWPINIELRPEYRTIPVGFSSVTAASSINVLSFWRNCPLFPYGRMVRPWDTSPSRRW